MTSSRASYSALLMNPPLSGAELAWGGLLGTWLFVCDVMLKILARVAACELPLELGRKLVKHAWDTPGTCSTAPLLGEVVMLVPQRHGHALFGVLDGGLTGAAGHVFALFVLALATIVTIIVLRWRWRSAGDAFALGVLVSGALIHAVPRLAGDGTHPTELVVVGVPVGIGDLALLWAIIWIPWRFVAEARA